MVARVLKMEGGYVWALKNYDGDFEVVIMINNSHYQSTIREVLSGSLRTTEEECVVIQEEKQI